MIVTFKELGVGEGVPGTSVRCSTFVNGKKIFDSFLNESIQIKNTSLTDKIEFACSEVQKKGSPSKAQKFSIGIPLKNFADQTLGKIHY